MAKRYIFLIGTLHSGGAERVVSILSRKMAETEQVEVLLYYDSKPFYQLPDNVKLTHVCRETGTKSALKNLFWMRRYFRANAEAVISFLAPFNMMAIAATRFSKTKIIVADRNDPRRVPTSKPTRWMRNFLYRFANGVVNQTRHNDSYFSKAVRRKSTVIANPIDLKEKAGLALRTEKKHKIVSVGRLIPQKNPMMLLRAFERFAKDHPDYELVCYGEGNMRGQMEAFVADHGLQGKVSLPGAMPDIFNRIADAEFYTMTSNYEGMPNALMEAMCLGLPVISTRVSGAADYIVPGENGLLVDIGDEDALLHAMQELADSPEKRSKLGQKASELNKQLELNTITDQWMTFIRGILNQ